MPSAAALNDAKKTTAMKGANASKEAKLAILTAGILFLLWWLVPHFQTANLNITPAARLALEAQIRDVWAKLLWAGLTAVGLGMIWRHIKSLTTVIENSERTLAAAERNAFFAAQGAATDRYARAMALLSDEKLEVRLGGIYSLERLARESEKDHGPIMEVLAAFVREQVGWKEGEPAMARPRADVQAILTVLGRRHAPFDPADSHIDLHGTALARAYLPWANLERAFLYETNMEGTLLQNANLRGAWLWKANLKDAVLDGAHLEGADLTGVANLTAEQIRAVHMDQKTKLPEHLRGLKEMPIVHQEEEVSAEDMKLPSMR
jgi:hypothetical protein